MLSRAKIAIAFSVSIVVFQPAWPEEPAKPAILEFLAPPGAKIVVDGKMIGKETSFSIGDLKPNEIRRIKVAVKFAGGGEDERLVDVQASQRIPLPLPKPGKDKPIAVATQSLTPIMAMALSHNGRLIAIGLDNGAAVLWDVIAGRPVRSFFGHRATIQSIAFSPDASQLLTGSSDTTAISWDVATGKQTRVFKGHTATIMSVAFSPDAKRIVTGSTDKTAIVWNVNTGEPLHALKGHKKEVFAVAVSPDGGTIATASFDTSAMLWDMKTGKEKQVLRGHKEEASCVAFSPDGSQLVTGSYENKCIVWETATGKRIASVAKHDNDIYSVTFTRDGKRFISGDREGVIMMWDIASGKKLRDFAGHIWEVSSVTVSADGRTLVSGSRDGMVKMWDMATGLEIGSLSTDASRKGWAVTTPSGYFDGSETGRQMVGYRFLKLPGAVIDQFFNDYYRPGLLTEISRGSRPLPPRALGSEMPPRIKIVSPTARTATSQDVIVTVEVVDQGSGAKDLALYNNGVRSATPAKSEPSADKNTTRVTFAVSLNQGLNKIRVKGTCSDGSWEAVTPEFELTYPRTLEHKSRMYVVAVGSGPATGKGLSEHAENARALAELLRRRGAKQFDRVDVLPLLDRDVTRTIIEEALRDVAELTRPQDALILILCGAGERYGDRIEWAPYRLASGLAGIGVQASDRNLTLGELTDILGSARALKRALIVDAASKQVNKEDLSVGLRGAVERIARSQGIYAIASLRNENAVKFGSGMLTKALLTAAQQSDGPPDALRSAATSEVDGSLDITEWFDRAGERQNFAVSSQARGFPILGISHSKSAPVDANR